jgi:hypothetical protein
VNLCYPSRNPQKTNRLPDLMPHPSLQPTNPNYSPLQHRQPPSNSPPTISSTTEEEELEEPEQCNDYFLTNFRRLTALDFRCLTLNESTRLFADRAPLCDCSTRSFPRTCYTLARPSHEPQSDEPVYLNYATCYECDFSHSPDPSRGHNKAIQRRQFPPTQVKRKSRTLFGFNYGLYAMCNITNYRFIIEYSGEGITQYMLNARRELLPSNSQHHRYDANYTRPFIIDARYSGNESRFVHHSCNPNAQLVVFHAGSD